MKSSSVLLIVCGAFGTQASQGGVFTLDEVSSQISSFDHGRQFGALNRIGTHQQNSSCFGCALACSFLNFSLPGTITYPETPEYEFEESQYWSVQQATASPICRFSPTSVSEVSLSILTLRVTHCEFAVKSGGHAAFYGASNINGGVTIDLVKLNQITVSEDQTETAVGPGNTWYDVYSKLDPIGLSVIGGRVAAIGVGGLTLGGGISFFSGRYGWACDNVNTYEVVFADGSIHNISYSSHPDLYFALRGGGNNFGIVTRFDLLTFPQGDLWAGSTVYLYSNTTAAAFYDAFYYMNINAPSDPYAAVILAFAYDGALGAYAIVSDIQYGKPDINPPILQNFTKVPGALESTNRITNLSGLTVEFNASNPGGQRETYWAMMTQNSPTLMSQMVEIWMESVNTIKDAENFLPALVFQPITTDMTSHFSKNGGNALGLSAAEGPLNLINLAISWTNCSDDTRILAAASTIISRINATAYAQGLGNPFIYQNYASFEQNVFPSYGKENWKRLKEISRKYDPEGVWQKLQPGYFKVFGGGVRLT